MFHREVDVCYSGLGLETSLVLADPQATHHIEGVVRQEHPAEFCDEFDSVADIVYILIVEEVAKIEA